MKKNNVKPMISVIVPVYNLEQYIEETLDSIIKQTYDKMEIIVVDDGSTDKTASIIDELSEQYSSLKVIHKFNGGVTNARLAGIKIAQGDWIGFVDGDDIIEEDMYEKLIHNALKYNAKISHCGYQMIFKDGRINYFYNTGKIVEQDNLTGVKDLLEGEFIEPGLCNKLFHKSLFRNLLRSNLIDANIKINEDLLMNYYLFLQSSVSVYEDICPYHYMVRTNSASRSKLNINRIYDPIKVKKIICDNAPNEIRSIAKKVYISTCINVYNSIIFDKEYKEEKRKINQFICDEKKQFNLLSKRSKILANLICYTNHLYPVMYKIYTRWFQKKRYE